MKPSGFADLIGIPFLSKGRDPAVGLDCWGMLMVAARRFGHEIPEFNVFCDDIDAIRRLYAEELLSPRWERIDAPEPGCIVAMAINLRMKDQVQHFGLYIGDGRVLHTMKKVKSCATRIDDTWRQFIKGYYRWKG